MPADVNPFAPLSDDEGEDDTISGDVIRARAGNFRRNSRSLEVSGRGGNKIPAGKIPPGSVGKKPKQVTFGCNLSCNQEFPTLPGTQKMPGVSLSQAEDHPTVTSQKQFLASSREQSVDAIGTRPSLSGSQSSRAPSLPFVGASVTRTNSGLIPFSELVDTILMALNVPESVKALAMVFIPFVKPFV